MNTHKEDSPASHDPITTKRLKEYPLLAHESEEYLATFAKTYGLKDISATEATEKGFSNTSDGIYIGYPADRDSRIRFYRTGFAAQTDLGKYGQRGSTPPALYTPPTVDMDKMEASTPVVITEGEFKAVMLDYIANDGLSAPCLVPCALGGVWSWRSSKQGVEVLPALTKLCKGRVVYLAFDMDSPPNPQVQHALNSLIDALHGVTMLVKVLLWDGKQGKGIDDYLASAPGAKSVLLNMLADAQTPAHVIQVMRMNERHIYDCLQDAVYDFHTSAYVKPAAFSTHYYTEKIHKLVPTTGGKMKSHAVPIGEYWLESPVRAVAYGKTFAPGAERLVPSDIMENQLQINSWKCWGHGSDLRSLKAEKGDVTPWLDYMHATFSACDLAPGETHPMTTVDYLITRLAWIFQQPAVRHPTWIYLIGQPLQGKSMLVQILSRLVGYTYTSNIDERCLTSPFSEWRAEKLLVSFDDVSVTSKSDVKQVLKRMTTEETTLVNRKYERAYSAKPLETFFFVSNNMDSLLDLDDRRALVLEATCPWTKKEWEGFDKWCGTPSSYNALLHYLLYEVVIDASFLKLSPPKTVIRSLVTESGESSWDSLINRLASGQAIQWLAPASGELREYRPTIITPEMLKTLFAVLNGPSDAKHEIQPATLLRKMQRSGARRVLYKDSDATNPRVYYQGRQTHIWTWSKKIKEMNRNQILDKLDDIQEKYPELFAAFQVPGAKY